MSELRLKMSWNLRVLVNQYVKRGRMGNDLPSLRMLVYYALVHKNFL